jgi:hypothetical protein
MWGKTTKCVKRNNRTRYEPDRVKELSYKRKKEIRRAAAEVLAKPTRARISFLELMWCVGKEEVQPEQVRVGRGMGN